MAPPYQPADPAPAVSAPPAAPFVPRVAPQETRVAPTRRPPKTRLGRMWARIIGLFRVFRVLRRHPIASTALLLCLAGAGFLVALAFRDYEEGKRTAHAVYKALAESKLSAPERAIISNLPAELRPALRIEPEAPEAWEALMATLPKEVATKDEFELLLPRAVIADATPTFQFRTPNADLPLQLTVRGADTERSFELPPIQSNQFPASFTLPPEVALPPGEYTWEIGVDRRRVELMDPPILVVPNAAQLGFRLVDTAEVDEIARVGGFAHDPMLDAYFQAYLLLEHGLAQRAAQVLTTTRPKGQAQARMVQRWRYLEAKAHAMLGERAQFMQLFDSAYLPAEGKPKQKPKDGDDDGAPGGRKGKKGKGKAGQAAAPPKPAPAPKGKRKKEE